MNRYTRKLKTVLQYRCLFKVIAIFFLIYAIIFTNIYTYKSKYKKETEEIKGIITYYKIKNNKYTIRIKGKETIIASLYLKNKKEEKYIKKTYEIGDKVKITGKIKEPNNNTIFNTFNYKKYLYNNKIYYLFEIEKIEKIENNTSLLLYIKNKIIKRINKIDKKGYISIFILGDKNIIDEKTIDKYQNNGISHLFSISGMHITLLAGIILKILKKISYNTKINYSIVIILLLIYLSLVNNSPSILRALISYILIAINKSYNFKIKSIDIILIVLIIIIIINPLYIYNTGFQFSYIISFNLILIKNKIKKIKKNYLKNIYISIICFLISLPITIYNYYQINILSILLNIILIPLVSIIIYPLSLITFMFPILTPIFNIAINILEIINNIAANIEIGKIIISKPSILLIIVYYLIIIISIYKNKFFLLIIILIVHINIIYINSNTIITLLDVGQGDSLLIKNKNNKENILIDTGGITNNKNNYSIVKNKTIPYLKSLGINKIHYLILTHGDYDHMGEAINLVNNFKVEKVIFNCGEFNDLEKELIKVLNKKKIKHYSCIKELNIDNNKLYFLQTKEYDNENDNSNVIYTELNGYKFMFMGDAGVEKEKDILDIYNISDVDVLKVGHHGSKTSSSKEFINKINPEYSIISVGKNNRYGHPNKEVLNNLEDSKIYRTDQDGSIMFKIKNNKLKIDTCSP